MFKAIRGNLFSYTVLSEEIAYSYFTEAHNNRIQIANNRYIIIDSVHESQSWFVQLFQLLTSYNWRKIYADLIHRCVRTFSYTTWLLPKTTKPNPNRLNKHPAYIFYFGNFFMLKYYCDYSHAYSPFGVSRQTLSKVKKKLYYWNLWP